MSETQQDTAGYWDSRYGERDQVWSGQPNSVLVAAVTGLPPGRALDLGCGEGADSVWLAGNGWEVTAADVSATAVARGRALADRREIPPDRITWLVRDLSTWQPGGPCELVSAFFLHSPIDFPRAAVLQRAAAAVAPGGHLLIVGHAEPPPWASQHEHADHLFLTPEQELASLELDQEAWDTRISEIRTREAAGPDGETATLRDSVVLLRRK